MGLAASALYLACVKNEVSITQRDLAEAAGVTEVTIRNRYKGLKLSQQMNHTIL
jgi:transcription initiation factor TFIIB